MQEKKKSVGRSEGLSYYALAVLILLALTGGAAEALTYYDIGSPTLTELWVDPVNGNDANTGTSQLQAVRSITQAWGLVPNSVTSTGYRINLLPGTYPCEPGPEADNCVNYFSDRAGTYASPVIIRAYNGRDTVTIRGGMNINNVQYLYLIDLNMAGGSPLPTNNSGNNLLHLAASDTVLLRGLNLAGPSCANDTCNNLQEVLKVNQVQHIYVEDSVIGGAWHTSVDYMVVQYGHFFNNRLHTAGQWCMYIKGGSAYFRVEGNELYGCQLGFEAGQSANYAMMVWPWLHYDAYDIKFVNNILHDIPGVGMAVSGGYNILFAYNTLYRVGISVGTGYALMDFVQAERNCTATDENPGFVATCDYYRSLGGWGPNFDTDTTDDPLIAIPNRNVYVYNNIFYNPSPSQTMYSHFDIFGPVTPSAGFQNLPPQALADDNLVIRGNVIWNGPPDLPLGAGDFGQGCQDTNPTCTATQLGSDNSINAVVPEFMDPEHGNFHPNSGGNIYSATTYDIPNFTWDTFSPSVAAGTISNTVAQDLDGTIRTVSSPPGAYRTTAAEPLIKRIFSGGLDYPTSPLDAYGRVTANGESILLRYGPYSQMTFDRPYAVFLRGGFGTGFRNNAAFYSTFSSITIIGGPVTIENIIVM